MAPHDPVPPLPAGMQSLIAYFALTFALAWTVWILAAVLAPDATGWVLLGAWAPTASALAVTLHERRSAGVQALLAGLIRWRISIPYWAFSILGVLVLAILAVAIHTMLGGTAPDLGSIAARFGFPEDRPLLFLATAPVVYLTTIFVGGPIAEELGWRGFAQARLQDRIGAGNAGLLIGLVWSVWHLPLFFAFPGAVGNLPLPVYIPLVTAFGVLFAWLYVHGRGSVLLCILLHASINFSLGVVGAEAMGASTGRLSIFLLLTVMLALGLYLRLRSPAAAPEPTNARDARF